MKLWKLLAVAGGSSIIIISGIVVMVLYALHIIH